NVGFDEQILSSFIDARRRFLKPGASMLPRRIKVRMAPVHAPDEHSARVAFFEEGPYGVDHSALRRFSARHVHIATFEPSHFRAKPHVVLDVDLAATDEQPAGSAVFAIDAGSDIHGLAAWFYADLEGVRSISNEPPNAMPSWSHGYFPFLDP